MQADVGLVPLERELMSYALKSGGATSYLMTDILVTCLSWALPHPLSFSVLKLDSIFWIEEKAVMLKTSDWLIQLKLWTQLLYFQFMLPYQLLSIVLLMVHTLVLLSGALVESDIYYMHRNCRLYNTRDYSVFHGPRVSYNWNGYDLVHTL